MKAIVVKPHLSTFARVSCFWAILLGCLSTPIVAQEPTGTPGTPTANAPIYKIGDTWTMLWGKTDNYPGVKGEQTVVSVTDNQTTLSISINGGTPFEEDFNDQGDITRNGSMTFDPSFGRLSFPMMVGKNWDARLVQRTTSGTYDMSQRAEVVAFERVEVTAGSFDAYKIVLQGVSSIHLGGASVRPFRATYWYAPSAKRIVKSVSEWNVYQNRKVETAELAAFSLAP
jgi:hypothetical protein